MCIRDSHKGVQICINLRPADIQTTIKEIRPTLMCSVPRFWEKVYAGVQEKINETTGLKKALMLDAIKVGRIHNLDYLRRGKTPPVMNQLKYKFYEKTIYSLLKKTIGIENGNFFPTAGAAVPDEINEFVHSVGINMVVGYGLTESTATVSCTFPVGYDIGSVGVVQMCIRDRPYSVWMTPREGFPMGIPSTTYKALLFPTIDLEPRMMTRVAPPTPEELFWMLTPATLPFKLFMKLASLATVSSELLLSLIHI